MALNQQPRKLDDAVIVLDVMRACIILRHPGETVLESRRIERLIQPVHVVEVPFSKKEGVANRRLQQIVGVRKLEANRIEYLQSPTDQFPK